MTQGYFVPQTADSITVKFLPHFEGYIWSFPALRSSFRRDLRQHGRAHQHGAENASATLSSRSTSISTEGAKFYSHVLPSPQRAHSFRAHRCWERIGRWSAMPPPGSIRSPAKASSTRCAPANCSADRSRRAARRNIPRWVKAAFSSELEFAARIVRRFYRGSFLGTAVTTRMVQFMRRSPVFRQLMSDLFSGTQDYTSLKRRLWGHLGITVSEFISSVLNLERPATAQHSARRRRRATESALPFRCNLH